MKPTCSIGWLCLSGRALLYSGLCLPDAELRGLPIAPEGFKHATGPALFKDVLAQSGYLSQNGYKGGSLINYPTLSRADKSGLTSPERRPRILPIPIPKDGTSTMIRCDEEFKKYERLMTYIC